MVHQIDYRFMQHVQADNQINLPALIFQDLIKIVRGSIKIISYGIHLSHIIKKMGYNVDMDLPLLQSKYTSFDKHTLARMQYVMDPQGNYVQKPSRALEHPKPKRQDELEGHHVLDAQSQAPAPWAPIQDPPTQGPPAPPLSALLDVQSIILDELIHMRQMMANHFAQVDRRLTNLEATTEAMFDEVQDIWVIVDALQATQLPPLSSQSLWIF